MFQLACGHLAFGARDAKCQPSTTDSQPAIELIHFGRKVGWLVSS